MIKKIKQLLDLPNKLQLASEGFTERTTFVLDELNRLENSFRFQTQELPEIGSFVKRCEVSLAEIENRLKKIEELIKDAKKI